METTSLLRSAHSADVKILIVRPDRIGDVVLSTPVIAAVLAAHPEAKITLLVHASIVPIVQGLDGVQGVMAYRPESEHRGVRGFFQLVTQIREGGFKIAICLQSTSKVSAAIFAAGVDHRIGPHSKPHSFLFFNRGVRQKRSFVEMHEADYNLQLVRRIGVRSGSRRILTRISVQEAARARIETWLAAGSLGMLDQPLIVVHPGMRGSALNWPENHYIELVAGLARDARRVVVSAGPDEAELLWRVRDQLGTLAEKVGFFLSARQTGLADMAALLEKSKIVVAPSTGPLHMAVALGKSVVTFYPPIRVQSALRWGPYVIDDAKAEVLVPEVYCGEDYRCRGALCNYFPCMKTLTVVEARERIERLLSNLGKDTQ